MVCMWIFPSKSRFLAWKLKLSVKIRNLIRILASKSKLLNKKIHNFGHLTRENSNLRPNLILAQKFKLTIFLVLVSTSIFNPKRTFKTVWVGILKNSKQVFLCCAVSDAGSQFPHLSVERRAWYSRSETEAAAAAFMLNLQSFLPLLLRHFL